MLNNEQLAILRLDIDANPTLSAYPNNTDNAIEIAKYYNTLADPAFIGWQSKLFASVSRDAVCNSASQLDNLTAGKRDALLYILQGTLDVRKPGIRNALDDLTGSQNTLKTELIAVQKRSLSVAEKLFATGTGTSENPATTTWEGSIQYQDVLDARAN